MYMLAINMQTHTDTSTQVFVFYMYISYFSLDKKDLSRVTFTHQRLNFSRKIPLYFRVSCGWDG